MEFKPEVVSVVGVNFGRFLFHEFTQSSLEPPQNLVSTMFSIEGFHCLTACINYLHFLFFTLSLSEASMIWR